MKYKNKNAAGGGAPAAKAVFTNQPIAKHYHIHGRKASLRKKFQRCIGRDFTALLCLLEAS